EIAASNSNQEKEKPPQDFDIRQLIGEECCIEVCEEHRQKMENTILELVKIYQQKELIEVKNVVEPPAERKTRIIKSLQNYRVIHKSSTSLKNTSQISLVHAIAPILSTKEPEYSPSMGYEHLSTTPKTELDEVTESSAKNLLPIPSECKVTSEDESKCDMPIQDQSSSVFMTFSNPLFNDNDDLTSSDDESLFEEDVPIVESKVYSNPIFDDDKIYSDELESHVKSNIVESLSNHDTPKFDYLEEFSSELAHINPEITESDFDFEEEIRLIENLMYDNSSPRPPKELNANEERVRREHADYISHIHFLEELLSDDSIPLTEDESLNSDHQDDLFFPRPPPEPPDVEFFFDSKPDVIAAMMNNIDEFYEDEYFNPGGEINVNDEDDKFFPFMFVIRIFLPYLVYPKVFSLLLSPSE
nr:hypothetical protein [Tanacetum cinerariifolium]